MERERGRSKAGDMKVHVTFIDKEGEQLSSARVHQYSQSFIPFSSKFVNSLPSSVFPTSYDLTILIFKREVSRHLSLTFD